MTSSGRETLIDEAITGPLGRIAAMLFLTWGGLAHFDAFDFPPVVATLFALLPIGLLFLAHQVHLRHMLVSIPAVLLLMWITLSISWTEDFARTTFLVLIEVPFLLGFMICGALLSERAVTQGLLWMVRAGVALSALATVAIPSTRAAVRTTGDVFEGWHALFEHKNAFGPFLALAFAIVLVAEDRRLVRNLTLVVIGVLILGSQSVTALTTALVVLALFYWLRVNRGLDGPAAAAAIIGSAAVAITGALGARASLPLFLEATGKDPTFSGRTDIWSAVIGAIRDRPIVGYGRGGLFFAPANEETVLLWREIGFDPPHAHNGVLDIWLQLGIVGTVLYLLLFASTIRVSVDSYLRGERFGMLGLLVMAMIFVAALSEPLFLGPYLSVAVLINVTGLRLNRAERLRQIREFTHDPADEETTGQNPASASGAWS